VEFEALHQAAQDKAEAQMSEEKLKELADEMIAQVGAFPDRSIISAYEAEPALNKLPDYIVGRAIEEILR
jgi:predicted dinucleotide-utilizing enzyme